MMCQVADAAFLNLMMAVYFKFVQYRNRPDHSDQTDAKY
ncbi:hypothetical protein C942_03999 [Photobacterium marinum]|uniref:Uncharacterized protein n=1 Tax=Photobacterium marinum TaxID=1056511 RepID=L8J2Y1_9GAMM|nr:hypothetical protein C942_03999 [Photobacterium marinum]